MATQTLPLSSSAAGLNAWVQYDDVTGAISQFGITAGTIDAKITVTNPQGHSNSLTVPAGTTQTWAAPKNFKWAVDPNDGSLSYPQGYVIEVEG